MSEPTTTALVTPPPFRVDACSALFPDALAEFDDHRVVWYRDDAGNLTHMGIIQHHDLGFTSQTVHQHNLEGPVIARITCDANERIVACIDDNGVHTLYQRDESQRIVEVTRLDSSNNTSGYWMLTPGPQGTVLAVTHASGHRVVCSPPARWLHGRLVQADALDVVTRIIIPAPHIPLWLLPADVF